MTLSIIIVSWNGEEVIEKCLESVYKNIASIEAEVFVVDNASSDKTKEIIKQKFSQINLIENDSNLGFSKACNIGLKKASGDYLLLLNQDMEVLKGSLVSMIDFGKKYSEAGVVGCKLLDSRGETIKHVRKFPKIFDQAMIILKLPHLFPAILNEYLQSDFNYNQKYAFVDSLRGSFFMISRKLLNKIGLLDERYFFWFEEVDYCRQAINAGFKVVYNGEAVAIDLIGQSVKKVDQYKRQKMFMTAMLTYFKKWHPYQYWILYCLRPIGLLSTYLYSLLSK